MSSGMSSARMAKLLDKALLKEITKEEIMVLFSMSEEEYDRKMDLYLKHGKIGLQLKFISRLRRQKCRKS